MFSWFKKFFNKGKKSSCCNKNTCGSANVWNKPQPYVDTNDSIVDTVVVNTIANSICMDQGHPMYCPSGADDNASSCCGDSASDNSSSHCDVDCSSSTDCSSSCCGDSGCCGD